MKNIKCFNWTCLFSLILWSVITLIRISSHSPWYDETHAWTIAQELNLFEIFRFMKTEGHTFIWYVLLMPFAKTNFLFPYSMLLLNWGICLISLIILWLKAPFSNLIKFLITFSFPFLAMYSVIARCYAIGILLLFMLIAMDKNKYKNPNIYATLLVLCANTSLMGTAPATVLGLQFAYGLIKNKQKLLAPFSIAILGAIVILLQLFSCVENGLGIYMGLNTLSNAILSQMKYNYFYYATGISLLSLLISIIFYIKNKIFPTFFIGSSLLITGIFYVYAGHMWHFFFYYIFFICSCWLINEKYYLRNKKLLNIALIIISVFCVLYRPQQGFFKTVWNDNKKNIAKDILKDENLKNSTIMIVRAFDTNLQPYLKKSDITLVNYCTNEVLNYNTMSFIKSKNCLLDTSLESELLKLDKSIFDKWYNDNLYILTINKIQFNTNNNVDNKDFKYKFILYKDFGTNYLWKIQKQTK